MMDLRAETVTRAARDLVAATADWRPPTTPIFSEATP
jgi:hypothetical protein